MSRKVMDCCNRWRSRTVSFRMSPEEDALLDSMSDTGLRIVTATAKEIAEVEKEDE